MTCVVPVRRFPPMPTVKEIIRLYKLRAKKQLAQNFLMDMNLTDKIVRSAGNIADGFVCEVGPGPGGITRSILQKNVRELSVIEKDKRFIPGLQLLSEVSADRMRIYHGDVLRFDMSKIFPKTEAKDWMDESPNIHIIGNLPFNVSTPLLIRWLEAISNRSEAWSYGRTKLTLTFQLEVAHRMTAPILNEQRSRLSIMCQYLCDVDHVFTIPGKAFVPPPKVNVGVVHIVPLKYPRIQLPFKLVEKVTRHVFHYRQKMFKRGIQTLFPPDRPELTRDLITLADVPPDTRPFMLTVEEMNRLCNAYKTICDGNPGVIDYDFRSKESAKQWREGVAPLDI